MHCRSLRSMAPLRHLGSHIIFVADRPSSLQTSISQRHSWAALALSRMTLLHAVHITSSSHNLMLPSSQSPFRKAESRYMAVL